MSHASVTIDGKVKATIDNGLLVLLGICTEDTVEDAAWLVKKTASLRIFSDENGVMNLSVKDIGGKVLVVSQFTLMASYKKGNRPSWIRAAGHDISIPLYNEFCRLMTAETGSETLTGEFGADMKVELLNDGPVTICMDSKNRE